MPPWVFMACIGTTVLSIPLLTVGRVEYEMYTTLVAVVICYGKVLFASAVVQVGRICSVKYENRGSNCLSSAPRYPIDYCFSEDFRASPVCVSDESKVLIKIWLEHWWDGADRGRRKHAEPMPLCRPQI
jgi:hypothetical protein